MSVLLNDSRQSSLVPFLRDLFPAAAMFYRIPDIHGYTHEMVVRENSNLIATSEMLRTISHSVEDIRLLESDCKESEENAGEIENTPINPYIYMWLQKTQNEYCIMAMFLEDLPSLDHGSKLRGPSPKSPCVAEQCDVNIQSINQSNLEDLRLEMSYDIAVVQQSSRNIMSVDL
ncbi:hypothetical protein TNCV_2885811 [Trichonephila clavipes]|nr:hypothetical protein TNCV_2885811 [Trichonephila clavipes]